jgi:hypothetical protein
MDQVHSLINRLTRQVAANVHSAELLSTIEMLRQEIMKAGLPQLRQGQSVCVWMPSTLSAPKSNGAPISFTNAADFQPIVEEVAKTPAVEIAEPEPVALKKEEPLVMTAPPRQIYTAPTPPPLVVAAEKPSVPVADRQEFLLKSEPNEEETADEAYMPKPLRPIPAPVESFPAPEINHAYIKVQELAAANHARISGDTKPFSKFAGIETSVKERFPVAPAPAVQKEINELVVDPAIPLNQKLKTSHTELGDVLAAGPRISDLKKAFGINDRFQFINSLFRGDNDMFDRSIRTLNNFGNYQEASFWMQRELVIKLGWNDDDELVQQFYKILQRRF